MQKPGNAPSSNALSKEFSELAELCSGSEIEFSVLVKRLESRGPALTTLIFAIPFLLPVPVPGLSTIFGAVIMAAGIAMMLNRRIWIPQKILNKKVKTSLLVKIFEKGAWFAKKLEHISKPRGRFLAKFPWMFRLNGFFIMLAGFILALPLPPGTNFPPALVILLLSLGTLEEDGIAIVLGYSFFAIIGGVAA